MRAHPSMRGPSRSCNVPFPRAAPPSRSISMAVNRPSTMLTKTSAPPPPPSSYLRTIVPRSVTLQSRVPSSYPLPTKTSPILPPHFLTSSIFERRQISLPSSPFNVRLPKEIHDLPVRSLFRFIIIIIIKPPASC